MSVRKYCLALRVALGQNLDIWALCLFGTQPALTCLQYRPGLLFFGTKMQTKARAIVQENDLRDSRRDVKAVSAENDNLRAEIGRLHARIRNDAQITGRRVASMRADLKCKYAKRLKAVKLQLHKEAKRSGNLLAQAEDLRTALVAEQPFRKWATQMEKVNHRLVVRDVLKVVCV